MTIRDSQRSRVYASDKELVKVAKPLPEIADVEKYVARLFKSKRFKKKYRVAASYYPPRVKDGRGTVYPTGGFSAISIPLHGRNEAIVLHEIAHTVADREYRYGTFPGHGWQYAAIYLDLVKWMMGGDAYRILKAAFKANKVKFKEPVKRQLTPEQRQALADRLRAVRQDRVAA